MSSYGIHRFFVPPELIDGESVTLVGDVADQLVRVLRARPGEQIVVLDDTGWEYMVTLESLSRRKVQGRVTKRLQSKGEPRVRITLYQAVLKADRFELVLQKGTELGVSEFVPVFCARSVPKADGHGKTTRYQRWMRIIAEAAEQSSRGRLPSLKPAVEFSDACELADGLALIPWEEESGTGLKSAIEEWIHAGRAASPVSLFTGPEGGLTRNEIERARASGIVPVSLGRRILRAETAAIAATTAILYEAGELGG